MLTKKNFQQSIEESVARYPVLVPLHQAGDPRLIQNLDAMATMLAMFSAQIESALAEPFLKTRPSTILSDAAMRGVIPKGEPAKAKILAINQSNQSYTIETSRTLIDSQGHFWRVDGGITLDAGEHRFFEASQVTSQVFEHTVNAFEPFYPILLPESEDDSFLVSIAVSDEEGAFEYREAFLNTYPDERVFQVEVDDRKRIFVRFGLDQVVGIQPEMGKVFSIELLWTKGDIRPALQSPFVFQYTKSLIEGDIQLSFDSLLDQGTKPPDLTTIRDICRYPSIYHSSAVYLGEFDFLVRRTYPDLQFLSIWNEAVEEEVRGANVDHINTLFVAVSSLGTELTQTESGNPDFASGFKVITSNPNKGFKLAKNGTNAVRLQPNSANLVVMGKSISEADLTDSQKDIRSTILYADNSYRVRFITPVISKIRLKIEAIVSTSHLPSDVQTRIKAAILAEWGKTAEVSKHGRNRPLYQQVYSMLRAQEPALKDAGSDLIVSIENPSEPFRPELWRFVEEDSLEIQVKTASLAVPTWGTR